MTTSNHAPASAFTIERQSLDLRFRTVTLVARERLTPNYVRVRLHGEELAGFSSPGADDHLRLFFPAEMPETVEELRAAPSREYTPLAWGEDWLDIEFVLHGDDGVAAPWAATAPLGSRIGRRDRNAGELVPRRRRDRGAGDPTLRRVDRRRPRPDRRGDRIPRGRAGDRRAGSALIAFLDGLGGDDVPGDNPFCFVAAEQSIVRPGRALLARWGIDPGLAVVKGYRKRGEAEYHAPH